MDSRRLLQERAGQEKEMGTQEIVSQESWRRGQCPEVVDGGIVVTVRH